MNDEVIYKHIPNYTWDKSDHILLNELTKKDFEEIDNLAKLMLDPDKNFYELKKLWETNKKFRIMSGGLIGKGDHVECIK